MTSMLEDAATAAEDFARQLRSTSSEIAMQRDQLWSEAARAMAAIADTCLERTGVELDLLIDRRGSLVASDPHVPASARPYVDGIHDVAMQAETVLPLRHPFKLNAKDAATVRLAQENGAKLFLQGRYLDANGMVPSGPPRWVCLDQKDTDLWDAVFESEADAARGYLRTHGIDLDASFAPSR